MAIAHHRRIMIAFYSRNCFGCGASYLDSRSNMRVTNATKFCIIARHVKPGNALQRGGSCGHDHSESAGQTQRLDSSYGARGAFGDGNRRTRR